MGKFNSDQGVLVFVACVVVFCMCFTLFFISTFASTNEYCATDEVPSTDVLTLLTREKIRVIIFYIVPSSL